MTEPQPVKYADVVMAWLEELGYTHCFFVAGGNIMHLLDGARRRMKCIPVVHEVAAGIAVEYFNESQGDGRAFALVTAGPGLTNIVTALGGAWLESRELLVLGGQVKSTDLATGGVRQRGIQEIDGVAIAGPVTVESVRIEQPISRKDFMVAVGGGGQDRCGPVFVELCLDAQGAPVDAGALARDERDVRFGPGPDAVAAGRAAVPTIAEMMRAAERPIWLLGGGINRAVASEVQDALRATGVPVMTTWNGADRVAADEPLYVGRPNTWGHRSANVLVAQADSVVALGTRLGLQQTGFNWQEFGRSGRVVQVDLDRAELDKGHPRVDLAVPGDANTVLRGLVAEEYRSYEPWVSFCREVREALPIREPWNETGEG